MARGDAKSLGAFGETYAAHFLEKQGYAIVDRNVSYPFGEIDIVAREGPDLVFLEVKTRRPSAFGLPEDGITDQQMDRLVRAIDTYLDGKDVPYRIETVAVEVGRSGKVERCELIPDPGLR